MDKKKILVVDDEEKVCQMIKSNLEKTGQYEVATETQGSKALETAVAFRPHLIFMDIMMPDLGGCEAAAAIKKHEKIGKTPIVFVTALAGKKDHEVFGGLVDGAPFIAKPIIAKPAKTKDLVKCIEEQLKPKEDSAS
ncbi:MAG: response regulator [Candidatus Omnitrophica bacterium CG11_big_fil_rev_8_21_14_0_20_45_26]|uniref:Response regulator n=1 Tax=Candidatus Abzuiibacterium crystallinum TaxID=1974748 RepID=A0A2H0LSS8_9BACT|nr:MAG: response regulator [Candidatus Omnitrophica bacterium CG11_big_fil_rev_8_21_14_0_20_45_26]PIW65617.1 MAG: response regulator [Candidatus Omnitrophica bacterium CG12_big_fil_rev_8_21_14_0_65_45_16]